MNVFWTPYRHAPGRPDHWKDMVWIEPKPAFPEVAVARNGKDHVRCSAVREYMKNVFVIRAPVDYTLHIDAEGRCSTSDHTKEFFDATVTPRSLGSGPRTLSLEWMYLFYANESVVIEALPPMFEHGALTSDIRPIPGCFDIGKWIRPVAFAFEVLDGVSEIHIKRGDPLLYVRFATDKKVKLVRVEQDERLTNVVDTCVDGARFFPGRSLSWLYELAAPVIKKFKGSKCPFRRMF